MDKEKQVVDSVDRDWLKRVDNVATKLAAAYGMPVPVLLLGKEGGPNAYATVGKSGPIMLVSTDMLRLIGDNDGYLAALIGHEFGHLAANHPVQGGRDMNVVNILGQLAGAALDIDQASKGVNTQGLGKQIGATGAGLINGKYSRDQERVADDLGIKHMAIAGFDPVGSPNLMLFMSRKIDGGNGLWTASHPSFPERYQSMVAAAKSLNGTYLANRAEPVIEEVVTDTSKRDQAVTASFPDWMTLRDFALFRLWLIKQPDSVGDKFESANPTDVTLVMKQFLGELPSLVNDAYARTDYSVAKEGYEYLAAKGNADAQVRLGSIYRLGLGVSKNEAKAEEWFLKASAKGNAEAMAAIKNLGQGDAKQVTSKASATPPVTIINSGVSSTGKKTVEDRLTELKSLFDKGLVSKQQFDQKRSEILKAL